MDALRAALSHPDLPPSLPLPEADDAMVARWAQHLAIVERENEFLNLTRIVGEEAATKHVLDSLLAWSFLPASGTVIDIGSGGGFPGLTLAIAAPHLKFVLTESVGKKAAFLQRTVEEMELNNVKVCAERAETETRRLSGPRRVQLLIARAVGSADKTLRVLRPARGRFDRLVLYKGPRAAEEEEAAREEAKFMRLQGKVHGPFELPSDHGTRALLEYSPVR